MKLLVLLLSLLWTSVALGQVGTSYPPDWIGFTRDLDSNTMDWPCHFTSVPFEAVTLHLVIANPSAEAVSEWHAGSFEVDGGIMPEVILTAGINIDTEIQFDVYIGMGASALWPNISGLVHLADLSFFVMSPGETVPVYWHPHDGSVGYSYSGPDETSVIPLTTSFWDSGPITYWVNQMCWIDIPTEQMSWSTIKDPYK